jgi:hypothetical protein
MIKVLRNNIFDVPEREASCLRNVQKNCLIYVS